MKITVIIVKINEIKQKMEKQINIILNKIFFNIIV